MERIKQAIEKARSQQPAEAGWASQPKAPSAPASVIPEEFEYSQTRVVELHARQLEKNRIFAIHRNDPTSVTFDLLRTQVLQKMEENNWRTLAITSPTPTVGKTVIAINLAISIAQQTNKTAMLVDFDLRQPSIGTYLGIPMTKSLNDLLEGSAKLSEVLVNPDIPRLVVLPTRDAVSNPSETLSSIKIAALVKEIRNRYESRIIIFDLPSLLRSDDSIAILPKIDCILLVVANGMSSKREIEDSLRLLSKSNLIGTVFNKA
jgi:protein-tyrosine kinase